MLFSTLTDNQKYQLVKLALKECNRSEANLSLRVTKLINSRGIIVTTFEVIDQLKKQ